PGVHSRGDQHPFLTEQGADAELDVLAFPFDTLAVAHQPPPLTRHRVGQPDFGDGVFAQQIGEVFGVAAVGLVGAVLHAPDVAGMGQADFPAGQLDELRGEIGGAAAGFEDDAGRLPADLDDGRHATHVVRFIAVEANLAVGVHDAYADGVFVIVESDVDG